MNTHNSEFEKLVVTVAVGLSFHRFDLVVCSFNGAGRDGMIVVGKNAETIRGKRPRHDLQGTYL